MSTTIGNYKVLDQLGTGPLGVTHRARDTKRGRTVALTLVAPRIADDPRTKAALLEAVASAAGLSHPHIAAIWEVGEEDGRLFIASEWASGRSLASLLGAEPIGVRRAVEIGFQLAEALAEGASHGLVHHDLRPENVLVTDRGQVKLLNPGLAAFSASEPDAARDHKAGEPHAPGPTVPATDPYAYASPEQVLGGGTDHRSDLFALGVVLYQMATGRHPFAGATPDETAVRVLQHTPPPPSELVADLPKELDAIVDRLLVKSLEGRHQAAPAVAAELRALAATLDERLDRRERELASRRRLRRTLVLALAVALAVAGAAAWIWYGRRPSPSPPPPAATLAPTVVVLPFEPQGGAEADASLATGFSTDLVVRLGRMPGVRVLGRSAARLPNRGTPAELAARLGASAAVTGTVASVAGLIRVDVSLLAARDAAVLLRQHFESGAAGALVLQEQIVDAVLSKLAVPPGGRPPTRRARRADPAAYDLLVQGRAAAERRDRGRAIELFTRSIASQEDLAEAHVALAEAIYLESFYGGGGADPAAMQTARAAAEAAGRIDPDLPPAHLARGLTADSLAVALDALAEATRLDPGYAEAFHQVGDQILEIDPEKALAFYRHSLVLDPGLDSSYRDIASAEHALGRLDAAQAAIAAGRAARPDRAWWKHLEARFEMEAGRPESALRLLGDDAATDSLPAVWLMGRVTPLALGRRTADALQSASRLTERHAWSCDGRAARLGLLLESGTRSERTAARGDLGRLMDEGTGPGRSPDARLCAATAAAASGDARRAAELLGQIAADEPSLRLWIRQSTVSPNLAFRRGWYPWTRVAGQGALQEAARSLDAALARLKERAADLRPPETDSAPGRPRPAAPAQPAGPPIPPAS